MARIELIHLAGIHSGIQNNSFTRSTQSPFYFTFCNSKWSIAENAREAGLRSSFLIIRKMHFYQAPGLLSNRHFLRISVGSGICALQFCARWVRDFSIRDRR